MASTEHSGSVDKMVFARAMHESGIQSQASMTIVQITKDLTPKSNMLPIEDCYSAMLSLEIDYEIIEKVMAILNAAAILNGTAKNPNVQSDSSVEIVNGKRVKDDTPVNTETASVHPVAENTNEIGNNNGNQNGHQTENNELTFDSIFAFDPARMRSVPPPSKPPVQYDTPSGDAEDSDPNATFGIPLQPFAATYYPHHAQLTDPVTKAFITKDSQLAILPGVKNKNNGFSEIQKAFVRASPREQSCEIWINGKPVPHSRKERDLFARSGIDHLVQFNKFGLDPRLRLTTRLIESDKVIMHFTNEFRFLHEDSDKPHIANFVAPHFEDYNEITFTTYGSIPLHWNKRDWQFVRDFKTRHPAADEALHVMFELLNPTEAVSVKILALRPGADDDGLTMASSVMNDLVNLVTGSKGTQNPMVDPSTRAYHMYKNQRGNAQIQAGTMIPRKPIQQAMAPLLNDKCDFTVPTIAQWAVERGYGEHLRHEEELQDQKTFKRTDHIVTFYLVGNKIPVASIKFRRFDSTSKQAEGTHKATSGRKYKLSAYLGRERNADTVYYGTSIDNRAQIPATDLLIALDVKDMQPFQRYARVWSTAITTPIEDETAQVEVAQVDVEQVQGVQSPSEEPQSIQSKQAERRAQRLAAKAMADAAQKAASEQVVSEQAASEQAASEQAASEQVVSEQVVSEQVVSEQVETEAPKDDGAIPTTTKPLEELPPYQYYCRLDFQPAQTVHLRRINTVSEALASSTGWHQLLRNELADDMPLVDLPKMSLDKGLTTLAEIKEAYDAAVSVYALNDDQWKAVKLVRELRGGLGIVKGPAGTGKTMTEAVIAALLTGLGYCVMVTTPTNRAAEVFVERYHKMYPHNSVVRIVSKERDGNIHKLGDRMFKKDTPDHSQLDDTHPSDMADIYMIREELEEAAKRGITSPNLTLNGHVFQRLAELAVKKHKCMAKYTDGQTEANEPIYISEELNMYQELTHFLVLCKQTDLRTWEPLELSKFNQALTHCRADVIRTSSLVCCTTSFSTSDEINKNFAPDDDVVVLVDEASQDIETDTVQAVFRGNWRSRVQGLMLFGDEKQLEVLNLASRNLNEFHEIIGTSMFQRFVLNGFPCVLLREQNRMRAALLEWPNDHFYDSQLTSAPTVPGIPEAGLIELLRSMLKADAQVSVDILLDCVINIPKGVIRKTPTSKSVVILEHIEFLVDKSITFSSYYGNMTNEKVAILVYYDRSKKELQSRFAELRRARPELTSRHLPEIATVDSSAGTEADFVMVNLATPNVGDRRELGMQDNDNRACVALTRGKVGRWIVTGFPTSEPESKCAMVQFVNDAMAAKAAFEMEPIVIPFEKIPVDLVTEFQGQEPSGDNTKANTVNEPQVEQPAWQSEAPVQHEAPIDGTETNAQSQDQNVTASSSGEQVVPTPEQPPVEQALDSTPTTTPAAASGSDHATNSYQATVEDASSETGPLPPKYFQRGAGAVLAPDEDDGRYSDSSHSDEDDLDDRYNF